MSLDCRLAPGPGWDALLRPTGEPGWVPAPESSDILRSPENTFPVERPSSQLRLPPIKVQNNTGVRCDRNKAVQYTDSTPTVHSTTAVYRQYKRETHTPQLKKRGNAALNTAHIEGMYAQELHEWQAAAPVATT
eukprot:scaffold7422_cov134-Isochrysis_galbana.AAC.3